jgi:RING finger family protein
MATQIAIYAWMVVAFGLLVGLMVLAVVLAKRETRRRHDALMQGAVEYAPAAIGTGDVRATVQGVTVRLSSTSSDGDTAGRIRADIESPLKGSVRVHPHNAYQMLRKYFGAVDIDVGDPPFDAQFVVEAESPDFAREFLTRELRTALLAQIFSKPVINLRPAMLTVRIDSDATASAESVRRFMAIVHHAAGSVAAMKSAPAVDVTIQAGACPVCASATSGDAVSCGTCRAAHHRDCWAYFGKCGIYACGGGRYTPSSQS